MTTVRFAQPTDAAAWLELRHALWPEGSEAGHRADIEHFFAGDAHEPLAVLLAEDGAGYPVGVAELSIRTQAEGCRGDRVAYLGGWFVAPQARGRGIGRALIEAAEEWGGAAAHRALGFTAVGLGRCFRKDLSTTEPHYNGPPRR